MCKCLAVPELAACTTQHATQWVPLLHLAWKIVVRTNENTMLHVVKFFDIL